MGASNMVFEDLFDITLRSQGNRAARVACSLFALWKGALRGFFSSIP
jgi:hypothetical protein